MRAIIQQTTNYTDQSSEPLLFARTFFLFCSSYDYELKVRLENVLKIEELT